MKKIFTLLFLFCGFHVVAQNIISNNKEWMIYTYFDTLFVKNLIYNKITSTIFKESLGVEFAGIGNDGKTSVFIDYNEDKIIVFDIDNSSRIKEVKISTDIVSAYYYENTQVSAISIDIDNKFVIIGLSNGEIDIWNYDNGELITKTEHSSNISKLLFRPFRKQFISCSADGEIKLWDILTGNNIKTLLGHSNVVNSIDISANGNILVSCSDDKTIKIWNINAGVCEKTFETEYKYLNVDVQGDGEYFITSLNHIDTKDQLWNKNTGIVSGKSIYEKPYVPDSIDVVIPTNSYGVNETFVLIIANENYKHEGPVENALMDGIVFMQYCIKTLGIDNTNIHFIEDASLGIILSELDWLTNITKAYKTDAKILLYYAGHGLSAGQNQESYILPSDGNSQDLSTAIKLDDIYSNLTQYPTKNITVILDACFNGSARNGGMLASARGTKLKPRDSILPGNMVVFSAASSDETAWPYKDKQHGLFTYYLLKKLHDTKGVVTYKELADYVIGNVSKTSLKLYNKIQTPTINIGNNVPNWEKLKLN